MIGVAAEAMCGDGPQSQMTMCTAWPGAESGEELLSAPMCLEHWMAVASWLCVSLERREWASYGAVERRNGKDVILGEVLVLQAS